MLLVPFHATAPLFSKSSNYELDNKINQSLQTKSNNNIIMWTQQNVFRLESTQVFFSFGKWSDV